jgi:hypothetical protein
VGCPTRPSRIPSKLRTAKFIQGANTRMDCSTAVAEYSDLPCTPSEQQINVWSLYSLLFVSELRSSKLKRCYRSRSELQ